MAGATAGTTMAAPLAVAGLGIIVVAWCSIAPIAAEEEETVRPIAASATGDRVVLNDAIHEFG